MTTCWARSVPTLAEHFRIVVFDRRGHGRTGDTDAPFDYADMATETVSVLPLVVGGPADLVGFSDGGNIASAVVLDHLELVGKVVPIGANFHYSGLLPLPFEADSPAVQMITDAYASDLPTGVSTSRSFFKDAAMFAAEPTLTVDDLRRITCPTLVMAADDDAIRLDHTCALFEALPSGQLAIVPGASHLVPIEKPVLVATLILEFLQRAGPPVTFMPIRRGPAG